VSCDAERITAYVDGALAGDPVRLLETEEHLAACETCRAQVAAERDVAARLRALPAPEPAPGLELAVRTSLRREHTWRRMRWTLPLAACLALVGLWVHGWPVFLAQELAWDHGHCFGKSRLPAMVWSSEPGTVASWFEEHDTHVPSVPESVGSLELVGARRCTLLDRTVAHLYYGDRERRVSLFVVPGYLRMPASSRPLKARGLHVRMLPVEDEAVAVVSDDARAVEAFVERLSITMVSLTPAEH
jgi:anti-sigma factor RsiW